MRLVVIDEGLVILELHPGECRRLAQACRAAISAISGTTAPESLWERDRGAEASLLQHYREMADALAGFAVGEEDNGAEEG